MTIDLEKSLSDHLTDLGCTHRPSKSCSRREILRADGSLVGTFDAQEAWDALGNRSAIFRAAEP